MNEGLLSSSSSVSHYKSDALLLRALCACLYTDLDARLYGHKYISLETYSYFRSHESIKQ